MPEKGRRHDRVGGGKLIENANEHTLAIATATVIRVSDEIRPARHEQGAALPREQQPNN